MVESGENNGLWPQEDWRIVEEWWKEVLEGWEGRSQSWVFELRVSEVVQAHVWHGSGLLGGVCVQGKIIQGEDASHLRADVEWVICVDADLTRKKVGVGRKKGITACWLLFVLCPVSATYTVHPFRLQFRPSLNCPMWGMLPSFDSAASNGSLHALVLTKHLLNLLLLWGITIRNGRVEPNELCVLHGTIVMFQWFRPIDLPILKAVLSRQ